MTHPVLVALDKTPGSRNALTVAVVLAELERAPLRLVHVAAEPATLDQIFERLGLVPEDMRGWVLDSRAGDPGTEIVAAAQESRATLLVMATHSGDAGPEQPLGKAALGVIEAAPCPLVLVNPERRSAPWHLRRILLPHDGTPTTSAALRPAVELARTSRAELLVLHVAATSVHPSEHGAVTAPRYVDQPQHEWPAWAQEFLERLGCLCPLESVKVRMSLARGDPAQEIARFAAEQAADLVVLAWRGSWERERAAIAKALVRLSPCPMMLIRAGT